MTFNIAAAAVPVAVTSITFTSIAFMLVAARLYTRLVMLRNAGADDYIMLSALCASIGFAIVVFYQIKFGLGAHIETIPLPRLEKFLQALWATIPTYNLALVLTKISIVFQYMRIFTTKNIVRLCRIMIAILIVYGCWTVLGSVFMCIPVSKFWDSSIKGRCMNQLAFWFSNAALNITTDIMIFAIPMPLLKQLQLPTKQKIGLMFVFGFGAFVCVTSVIRLKSLYEISISPDPSVDGVNAAIWSGIEINVAIACASLPSLKPLISRVLPNLLSNPSSRHKSNVQQLSGEDLSSHQMNSFRNKSKTSTQLSSKISRHEEIKIEQTIYQERQVRPSIEGSQVSLANWKTDCYSVETKVVKHPLETV